MTYYFADRDTREVGAFSPKASEHISRVLAIGSDTHFVGAADVLGVATCPDDLGLWQTCDAKRSLVVDAHTNKFSWTDPRGRPIDGRLIDLMHTGENMDYAFATKTDEPSSEDKHVIELTREESDQIHRELDSGMFALLERHDDKGTRHRTFLFNRDGDVYEVEKKHPDIQLVHRARDSGAKWSAMSQTHDDAKKFLKGLSFNAFGGRKQK